MKTDAIVLGILSEKPATGYEIKETFSTIFSNFYNASFGSVYPILHRLAEENEVEVELVEQTGKPNKKIYSLTTKGRQHFEEALREAAEPKKIKWEFMVHLFYASQLTAAERQALIDNEIQEKETEIALLGKIKEAYADKKMDPYQEFCLEYGIKQKQFTIDEIKKLK